MLIKFGTKAFTLIVYSASLAVSLGGCKGTSESKGPGGAINQEDPSAASESPMGSSSPSPGQSPSPGPAAAVMKPGIPAGASVASRQGQWSSRSTLEFSITCGTANQWSYGPDFGVLQSAVGAWKNCDSASGVLKFTDISPITDTVNLSVWFRASGTEYFTDAVKTSVSRRKSLEIDQIDPAYGQANIFTDGALFLQKASYNPNSTGLSFSPVSGDSVAQPSLGFTTPTYPDPRFSIAGVKDFQVLQSAIGTIPVMRLTSSSGVVTDIAFPPPPAPYLYHGNYNLGARSCSALCPAGLTKDSLIIAALLSSQPSLYQPPGYGYEYLVFNFETKQFRILSGYTSMATTGTHIDYAAVNSSSSWISKSVSKRLPSSNAIYQAVTLLSDSGPNPITLTSQEIEITQGMAAIMRRPGWIEKGKYSFLRGTTTGDLLVDTSRSAFQPVIIRPAYDTPNCVSSAQFKFAENRIYYSHKCYNDPSNTSSTSFLQVFNFSGESEFIISEANAANQYSTSWAVLKSGKILQIENGGYSQGLGIRSIKVLDAQGGFLNDFSSLVLDPTKLTRLVRPSGYVGEAVTLPDYEDYLLNPANAEFPDERLLIFRSSSRIDPALPVQFTFVVAP